jgi:hypothetical protein
MNGTPHKAMDVFNGFSQALTRSGRPDGSLAYAQKDLDEGFSAVVTKSPLRLWSPGDPVTGNGGKRLLIGVATWSGHDMMLLDAVSQALQESSGDLTVDVFNVDCCLSQEAFERYVPGIGDVLQTPIVGLWSNGKLVDKATGKAGRDLVSRVTGLPQAQTEFIGDLQEFSDPMLSHDDPAANDGL